VALATGDLLVLSAALAGGCIYDLLVNHVGGDDGEDTKNFLLVSAALVAMGAAAWFGDMKDNPKDATHSAMWTLAYLGFTVLVCVRALYLTFGEHHASSAAPRRVMSEVGAGESGSDPSIVPDVEGGDQIA